MLKKTISLLFLCSVLSYPTSALSQISSAHATLPNLPDNEETQAISALAIKTFVNEMHAMQAKALELSPSACQAVVREIPQTIFPFRLFYTLVTSDSGSTTYFFVSQNGKYRILNFLTNRWEKARVRICSPEMDAMQTRQLLTTKPPAPSASKKGVEKYLKKMEHQLTSSEKTMCEDWTSYFFDELTKAIHQGTQKNQRRDESFPEMIRLTMLFLLPAWNVAVIQSDQGFDYSSNRKTACDFIGTQCPFHCVPGKLCWDESTPAFSPPVMEYLKGALHFHGWVSVNPINGDTVEQIEEVDLKITTNKITFANKQWADRSP